MFYFKSNKFMARLVTTRTEYWLENVPIMLPIIYVTLEKTLNSGNLS